MSDKKQLYLDVEPPATKSESCQRHSLKRNEKMGSKPNQNRSLVQNFCLDICLSPHGGRPTSCPHPCLLHSPNLHISITRKIRGEGEVLARTTFHPHPHAHSILNIRQRPPLPPPTSLQGWLNPPFPNLTSALSRLSRTPASSCRHRALAYSRPAFLRQTASSLC